METIDDHEDGGSNVDANSVDLMRHVLGVALSVKGTQNKRISVWIDTRDKPVVIKIGNCIKNNFRIELTDKDIGEMIFHDFETGNKSYCVIANTGKKDRKVKKMNEPVVA